jgi:hypothetical protein
MAVTHKLRSKVFVSPADVFGTGGEGPEERRPEHGGKHVVSGHAHRTSSFRQIPDSRDLH